MTQVQTILDQLCEKAEHPARTVAESCKSTGKEAVGRFPIYSPEELVYAAGFLPVGIWGGATEISQADRYFQGFCCSIMRANMEYGLRGTYRNLKAVLIPTLCDTLKCVVENWKVAVPSVPVIPVVYPQNRTLTVGQSYLREEYLRIADELAALSQTDFSPEALEEAFTLYERYRKVMREFCMVAAVHPKTINAKVRHLVIKAAYFMDKAEYTPLIARLTDELKLMPAERCAVRVVATGLLAEPLGILDSLVENDIAIVADDLAQESRQFRTPARETGDALDRMVWRIADLRGCPYLYEEQKTRGELLKDLVRVYRADGVVTIMMKFCDPDEFDYPVIKQELEQADIPNLYLEVEQGMTSFGQAQTRIQSFAEMLA